MPSSTLGAREQVAGDENPTFSWNDIGWMILLFSPLSSMYWLHEYNLLRMHQYNQTCPDKAPDCRQATDAQAYP